MVWGYSSVGERSVRIRKAVGSNPIISTQSRFEKRLFFLKYVSEYGVAW